MTEITNNYFIVFDIIVLCILLITVSNGWKRGALRSLTDFLSSAGKVIISGFGAYRLMKIFNPIPADKVSSFLLHMLESNSGADAPAELGQPELVEVMCRLLCVLAYFILFMIILSAIERALVKKHRDGQEKEDRTVTLPDHIAGAVLGLLLFLVCTILPCPWLISAQKLGVITNGKDLVYQSFFQYPVNLGARPLTRLIAGEETDRALWEEKGILIFEENVEELEDWWKEYEETH